MFKNANSRLVLAVALAGASVQSFAAGTDYSSLTGAVDFSTVGVALLAIAALMIVPKVVAYGARKVMAMVKG